MDKNLMFRSYRRKRVQEKRLIRRIVFSLGFLLLSIIIVLYVGLPLLARLIVGISSLDRKLPESAKVEEEFLLFAPVLNPLPEATNSGKIKISGFAAKDLIVVLVLNGATVKKTETDKSGIFEEMINLEKGENEIKAKVVKDDKESNYSDVLMTVYMNKPPKIEITSPAENEEFSGLENEITISGTTDSGNQVIINNRMIIVNSQGEFEYQVKLSQGENKFEIKAIDKAGNETTKEVKVNYEE